MNILRLTDRQLSEFRQDVLNESARRTKAAVNGHDAASIIYGNEAAKRALLVAAAGGHSILFLGPGNSGKSMLRALALELGLAETYESRPCPCGNHGSTATCRCTVAQVQRSLANHPSADVTVSTCRPLKRDWGHPGTNRVQMRARIAACSPARALPLDKFAEQMLDWATQEFALDPLRAETIQSVASTVARLEGAEQVQSAHLCEAINYRTFSS